MDEVLAANYIVSEWKPELITEILSKLTPDNCRYASPLKIFFCVLSGFFSGLE
jgi:hypothetical protein